ncbi:uncharacterized protein [Diadema antillarum]|uniref:uncharacterized protein n=1 Tax=Diadema antillarum TaxID=105358 RepID=UPI003A865CD1
MFPSSVSYPQHPGKTYKRRCECRRGPLVHDREGNEVGCITGHRSKRSAKIVFLRGDPSPVRRLPHCPVHGFVGNENEKNRQNMEGNANPRLTFKDIIVTWHQGVEKGKCGLWQDAFNSLQTIKDYSAKIRFNLGQIAWMLENPELARENFAAAVSKDPHMALGHFQLGMVYYRLQRYNESRNSYDQAKVTLRGNKFIDYRQLGFVHKLYECEVLYNLALTYATMMSSSEYALELLHQASKVTVEARHGTMIEKAEKLLMSNQLYEPLVLPTNQLFRPPQSKVANLKNIDYLGKAKVLSELSDSSNNNNKANFQAPSNTFRPIDDDFSDDDDEFGSSTNGGSSPTPSMMARMTHKDTIAIWHEGVLAFERGDLEEALNQHNGIVDPSAKILYNIGVLQKSLGQTEDALATFQEVVSKDPHLAIGHFLLGIVLGHLQRHEEAWRAFEKTHETLRGNPKIDYKQLGLQYKLYKCEILHNEAWTYNELDQRDWAQKLLDEARIGKSESRHDKIDDSYRDFLNGHSFKLLEPPKALLFKPPKSKIDNLERKDYLGKAKIVAKLPSQRQGSSTPPPKSSSSLGVSALPPRSKTPTPSSAKTSPPPSKPPPISRTQNASAPVLPSRPIPSQPPRLSLPVPTIQAPRSASPGPPNRPLPSKKQEERKMSGGFNFDKPLPAPPPSNDSSSPSFDRQLSADVPPSRPLPSPSRSSPVPDRPVPQAPRTSPIPDRPVPQPPRTSPVPDRALPPPPRKTSSPDLPDRPVPQVPQKLGVSDIPNRPVPPSPKVGRADLGNRPVPPRPLASDIQSRAIPPVPTDEPDLPSRPTPPAPRNGSVDLSSRPLPLSPNDTPPSLPSRVGLPTSKLSASDLANRPVPPSPKSAGQEDLPSRPVPPVPRASSGSLELPARPPPVPTSPKLPARPLPKKASGSGLPDDLPTRAVPPPPVPKSSEPELPERPSFLTTKTSSSGPPSKPLPGLPSRGSPAPERRVPSLPKDNNNFKEGRRLASPGLPDLPPPPVPQKVPSPLPQRRGGASNTNNSNDSKPVGFKAKLVKIEQDSPPVVRRAAAVNVQKEEKPSLPKRPEGNGKPSSNSGLGGKPPILAFRPDIKSNQAPGGGSGPKGHRKTALVIQSYDSDVEGEISVSEGDLVTVLNEDGDWLKVEIKGHSGRLPKSCVKGFHKPSLNL